MAPKIRRSRKKAAPKQTGSKVNVVDHGFPPGTKVSAHDAATESPADDKAPYTEALAKATVAKDGTLEFAGLKAGHYIAAGEVDAPETEPGAESRYLNVGFAVNG